MPPLWLGQTSSSPIAMEKKKKDKTRTGGLVLAWHGQVGHYEEELSLGYEVHRG